MIPFSIVFIYILSIPFTALCLAYYLSKDTDAYINNVVGLMIVIVCPIFNLMVGGYWLAQGFNTENRN